jgi:hypothetical protein
MASMCSADVKWENFLGDPCKRSFFDYSLSSSTKRTKMVLNRSHPEDTRPVEIVFHFTQMLCFRFQKRLQESWGKTASGAAVTGDPEGTDEVTPQIELTDFLGRIWIITLLVSRYSGIIVAPEAFEPFIPYRWQKSITQEDPWVDSSSPTCLLRAVRSHKRRLIKKKIKINISY